MLCLELLGGGANGGIELIEGGPSSGASGVVAGAVHEVFGRGINGGIIRGAGGGAGIGGGANGGAGGRTSIGGGASGGVSGGVAGGGIF